VRQSQKGMACMDQTIPHLTTSLHRTFCTRPPRKGHLQQHSGQQQRNASDTTTGLSCLVHRVGSIPLSTAMRTNVHGAGLTYHQSRACTRMSPHCPRAATLPVRWDSEFAGNPTLMSTQVGWCYHQDRAGMACGWTMVVRTSLPDTRRTWSHRGLPRKHMRQRMWPLARM
jgi:hypothetical protein